MTQKRTNLLLWIVVGGGAFLFFILVLLGLVVYFADGGSRSLSLSDGKVALLKLPDQREIPGLFHSVALAGADARSTAGGIRR